MRILLAICLLFALTGCGGEEKAAPATNAEVPETIAVKFFQEILVNNDTQAARRYLVPTMVRVLDSYTSGRAYARTMLNMRFDQVEITVEDTNKSVREFYTDSADVMLIFVGTYDGNKQVDMRMVKMTQQRGSVKCQDEQKGRP